MTASRHTDILQSPCVPRTAAGQAHGRTAASQSLAITSLPARAPSSSGGANSITVRPTKSASRDAADQGDRGFYPETVVGIGEIWKLLRIEHVEVEMDMHRSVDGALRIQPLQIQLAPHASVSTSAVLTAAIASQSVCN